MKKISFFVGQGYNKYGEEFSTKKIAILRKKAYLFLMQEFGGFTVLETFGGYKNFKGEEVFEPGIQVVVYGNYTEREIENAAKFLRELFEQEQVLYTVENAPEARFV